MEIILSAGQPSMPNWPAGPGPTATAGMGSGLGSWLAEESMRKLDRKVERQGALLGFKTTRRYSPGYKDFALQAQEVFYRIIRNKRPEIELYLSQAHVLAPEKTVTALKGEFSPE